MTENKTEADNNSVAVKNENDRLVNSPVNSRNVFRWDGKNWDVCFGGVRVPGSDSVGMFYIHYLIECKGRDVFVAELVTKMNGEPVDVMKAGDLLEGGVALDNDEVDENNGDQSGTVCTTEFADEILSDEDRGFVIKLLEKEKEYLTVLKSKGLAREVLEKKEDIQKIEKYLKDHRFGFKNTCYDNRASRDRKSVSIAIKRVIESLGKKNPSFADHLRESITKGTYCSYTPTTNVEWTL